MRKQAAAVWAGLILGLTAAFPAMAGEWELSEDGKYWTYCESPGNPVEDEWIEDKGKTYYVDAKGRMKTGWVTDQESGNKYFMGEDGAMCLNTFTKDNKYVGPDGLQVEKYDTYRKAVRSQLKKATRKKSSQQYFLMTDLNLDEYLDLVVMEGTEESKNLVEIDIWDPDEEKFQLTAEFDEPEEDGARSHLYRDPQGNTIWLEIVEANGDLRLFQLEDQDAGFKGVWSFVTELDDWGGAQYLVNGEPEDRDEWDQDLAEALGMRGDVLLDGYLPSTEENIKALVDRVLTEEELEKW